MQHALWTIGHSTHTQEQLVDLLHHNNIRMLVDVRTIPKSSRNPQFNKDELTEVLPQQYGIKYVWMGKELGGLRKRNKDLHVNEGWENLSFRGYADYMQTPEFQDGIEQLMHLAHEEGPAAIMCAEAVYFSCHRRLISDALTAAGWTVWHIMPQPGKQPQQHTITAFARVEGTDITYPAESAAAATELAREAIGKKQADKQIAARKDPNKQPAEQAAAAKPPAATTEQPVTLSHDEDATLSGDLAQDHDSEPQRPITRAVKRATKQLKIGHWLLPKTCKKAQNG